MEQDEIYMGRMRKMSLDEEEEEVTEEYNWINGAVSPTILPTSKLVSSMKRSHTSPISLLDMDSIFEPQSSPSSFDQQQQFSLPFTEPLSSPLSDERYSKVRRIKSVPVMTGEPLALESQKKARKAKAARDSRRRKKMYIQSLEKQVEELTTRLSLLQSESADSTKKAVEMHRNEQKELKETLESILADHEEGVPGRDLDEEKLSCTLKSILDHSRARHDSSKYFLEVCKNGLLPDQVIKFALLGLGPNWDYLSSTNFWEQVMRWEIGLEPEQIVRIQGMRGTVDRLLERMSRIERNVVQVQEGIDKHLTERREKLDKVRRCLSEKQFAKFILWVHRNPLCMQMLETVWKQ